MLKICNYKKEVDTYSTYFWPVIMSAIAVRSIYQTTFLNK